MMLNNLGSWQVGTYAVLLVYAGWELVAWLWERWGRVSDTPVELHEATTHSRVACFDGMGVRLADHHEHSVHQQHCAQVETIQVEGGVVTVHERGARVSWSPETLGRGQCNG